MAFDEAAAGRQHMCRIDPVVHICHRCCTDEYKVKTPMSRLSDTQILELKILV
jgi:hypothetical protein